MQLAVLRHAFYRHDIRAVRLGRKHGATLDRTAIDMDDAGPALTRVAADVCASPAEMFANHLDQ
jgi:hypothetical protein